MSRLSLCRVLGVAIFIGCGALTGCSESSRMSPTARSLSDPGLVNSDGSPSGTAEIGSGSAAVIDAMITRVDLTSSSLTLSSGAETVLFDDNTLAFKYQQVERGSNPGSMGAEADKIRVPLVLSDLSLGDTIRVSAEVMSETTLKAVEVELAGEFHDPWADIQFSDRLASVDTLSREVTFQNNPFGGVVFICAMLNGADGSWLWLTDFHAGELVDVKGHTLEDGTFEIIVLQKVAE